MIMEFFFANILSITLFTAIGIVFVITMSGFIGNININSGGGNVNISGANAEMEQIDETTESIDPAGASGLLVTNPVGDVKVKVSNDGKVSVVKKLNVPKATPENERINVKESFRQSFLKQNGPVVELYVPRMPVLGAMSASVDLEISAPKAFGLKHNAGVNDITVEDLEGNIEVQNNAGNINLMRLPGSLTAHTNSGNIKLHDLKKPVSISANAGNIAASSLSLPSGNVNITSHVGSIEMEVVAVDPAANCQIKSNTGEASLIVNRDVNLSLEASTNMGQLNVDPNINVTSRGPSFMGGSVSAVVNNPGGKINVSSNTGAVTVKLK